MTSSATAMITSGQPAANIQNRSGRTQYGKSLEPPNVRFGSDLGWSVRVATVFNG